ncbi:toxin-activating lysine-acyltransferase [Pseudomonas graminis]|uniref:toxin-activating lysine-acyltransferase n=1 Tax=Pseudomonas graminis TaxID=158627 RepID=UPI00349F0DD8
MTYCNSTSNTAVVRHAHDLGYAVMLITNSPTYRFSQVLALKIWIEPAILHQQIAFIFSGFGDVRGYYTWALLSDEVSSRLINDADFMLHPSEWNEGSSLWIIDFCFPYGDLSAGIQDIRCRFRGDDISWVRRDVRLVPRKIIRSGKSGFSSEIISA